MWLRSASSGLDPDRAACQHQHRHSALRVLPDAAPHVQGAVCSDALACSLAVVASSLSPASLHSAPTSDSAGLFDENGGAGLNPREVRGKIPAGGASAALTQPWHAAAWSSAAAKLTPCGSAPPITNQTRKLPRVVTQDRNQRDRRFETPLQFSI